MGDEEYPNKWRFRPFSCIMSDGIANGGPLRILRRMRSVCIPGTLTRWQHQLRGPENGCRDSIDGAVLSVTLNIGVDQHAICPTVRPILPATPGTGGVLRSGHGAVAGGSAHREPEESPFSTCRDESGRNLDPHGHQHDGATLGSPDGGFDSNIRRSSGTDDHGLL